MVDILTKGRNGWEFYEAKSAAKVYKNKSTKVKKVKDVYIHDVAIQYYVLNGSGLDISSAFLVHINNQYVRQGPLEVDKLFSFADLTETAIEAQNEVVNKLGTIRKILNEGEP
jgi:hypothetical protein